MLAVLGSGWRFAIVVAAGVAAGVSNGVAGGGTFITFPTLLALGVPALTANITTTVGVVPGSLGALGVFGPQLRDHRDLLPRLVGPVVAGSLTGSLLLLAGSPDTFRALVPWLIGAATALFAVSPLITRRLAHVSHEHPARRAGLYVGTFAISVYGGYFGAGIGIMLLALLGLSLSLEVKRVQGLRNAIAVVVTAVAAVVFAIHGHLDGQGVVALWVGTLVGGWLGAQVVARLSPLSVRVVVVTVGVVTTVKLALG